MSRSMTRRQAMKGLAALGPAALAMPAAGAPRPPAPPAAAGRARPAAQEAPHRPLRSGRAARRRALALRARHQRPPRPRPRGPATRATAPPSCCSTASPSSPTAGATSSCPSPTRATTFFAPDMRGYGRTTGWDADYDGDLASFRRLNVVRDALGLVHAFGYRDVAAVIGHDFGSPVAAWCARIRPDVFRSVAMMSAPQRRRPDPAVRHRGRPAGRARRARPPPCSTTSRPCRGPASTTSGNYRTREANANMWRATQGLHAFLRGYYHYKSADWLGNRPYRLAARTAAEMAKMPTYYIMGPRRRHGRDRRQAHAVGRPHRRQHVAARRRAAGLHPRNTAAPASRED